MREPIRLVIRADASARIGVGHVMRCLALGQAWQDEGLGAVEIVAAELPDGMVARVGEEGFRLRRITAAPGSRADVDATCGVLGEEPSAVVIDGYGFEEDYQRAIREAATASLVLDDEVNRSGYAADLLLNQNVHATPALYPELEDTRLLLGLTYVLIRREFREAAGTAGKGVQPRRLLVSLGGADQANLSPVVMTSFAAAGVPGWELTVVVGAANPQLDELRARAEDEGVELLSNVSDMASLMARCDAAFVAAGSILWETLLTGLPTCCVIVASNQEPLAEALSDAGVVVSLGWAPELDAAAIEAALSRLLSDNRLRARLRQSGLAKVDGAGASRVARALYEAAGGAW